MKLIKLIKTWLANRKKRKITRLIVKNHVTNQINQSRAKDMENAIFESVKIVTRTNIESEVKHQQRFDNEFFESLQNVIKKYYADKDKKYNKKDIKIINLQKTIEKKSELLNNIQEKVRAIK